MIAIDQNDKKSTSSSSLKSSFRLIKMVFETGKLFFIVQFILRILCGLLPAVTAFIWQQILQNIQSALPEKSFIYLFITLAIIGGLSASYFYFTEIADTFIRNRISLSLQKKIHNKASKLPMNYYESPALQDMLARASGIFCYGNAVGFIMTIFGLIQQIIAILSIVFVVWSFQPLLAFGVFILLIPGFIQLGLNKKEIDLDLKLSLLRREAGVFRGYLTSRTYMKDIQMMNISDYFFDKWESIMKRIYFEERNSNIHVTWIHILIDVIERGTTVVSYALCVYLALKRQLNIADFGAVIVLIGSFIQNSTNFMNQINGINREALSVQSAIGYFDLICEERNTQLSDIKKLEIKNVSYTYPESKHSAVNKIDLSVENGETLVIVGKNGSGKSTLSKLMMGLIDPTVGQILANDIPLNRSAYPSLYRSYSAVFQDYLHYAMTVRDNISISDKELNMGQEELYQLLKDIGISFIRKDSNINLDTELGAEFGGIDLSGGQWQQLAIARAAFRNAQIVVLDEPTSALDPLREAELYDTFRTLCKNKIGIIVTHRLGMCSFADKILVMDEGKIIEYGSFHKLIQQKGLFSKMYLAQQKMYTKNGG